MKAERQQKEVTSRVIQSSKGGGGLNFLDNRPESDTHNRLLQMIQSGINSVQENNIVQLKKDEYNRSKKQRRVAHARKTIGLIAPTFKPKIRDHLFNGKPADGGAIDQSNPTGLHCYTHGVLPENVVVVARQGSPSKVHELTWRWNNHRETKASTMFPNWLTENNVITLIGLKYNDLVSIPQVPHYDETREYIKRGYEFDFTKHGDTIYPD